jgi:hypothetical protein
MVMIMRPLRLSVLSGLLGIVAVLLALPAAAHSEPNVHAVSWIDEVPNDSPDDGDRLFGVGFVAARARFDDGISRWRIEMRPEAGGDPAFCDRSGDFGPDLTFRCNWDTSRLGDMTSLVPDQHLAGSAAPNGPYVITVTVWNVGRPHSMLSQGIPPEPHVLTPVRTVIVANPVSDPTGVERIYDATTRRVTVSWAPNPEPDIYHYLLQAKHGTGIWQNVAELPPTRTSFERLLTDAGTYQHRVAAVRPEVSQSSFVETPPFDVMPSSAAPAAPPPSPGPVPAPLRSGYWMVGSDGKVFPFADAMSYGNAGTSSAVDLEPTPSGNGYWIVDDLGRIFAFGDALARGNVDQSKLALGEKATSLSATRSGNGYWIFTSKGRVLTFGDAAFLGDVSTVKLNGPVLDSITTPSGAGYYMVASDGGIFAFGDALFYGSMGGATLNAPVQSLVPDADSVGYWLVAADGGIFSFAADFKGSLGSIKLNCPVTGMVRSGPGYLMVGEDGGIFDFSGTTNGFKGSLGANPPTNPIVSVAILES